MHRRRGSSDTHTPKMLRHTPFTILLFLHLDFISEARIAVTLHRVTGYILKYVYHTIPGSL